MIHAETNLIYCCARHGISMDNSFVVVTLSPCRVCMRALFQCNVKEIYFKDKYKDFDEQVKMEDLKVTLTNVGNYGKIELEPK